MNIWIISSSFAIMENVISNILMQVWCINLRDFLGDIYNCRINNMNIQLHKTRNTLYFKMAVLICILTINIQKFYWPTSNSWSGFNFWQLNEWKVVFYCSLELHFPDYRGGRAFIHIYYPKLFLLWNSVHFLHTFFLFLIYRIIFIFLIITSYIYSKYILPVNTLPFLFV